MRELGMGALLGVGQGSVRESQLVVIRWNGAEDPKAQPVAFIGKGVCFDTGGISIKPADGMEDMKLDMGGAGAVTGLMHVLAGRIPELYVAANPHPQAATRSDCCGPYRPCARRSAHKHPALALDDCP